MTTPTNRADLRRVAEGLRRRLRTRTAAGQVLMLEEALLSARATALRYHQLDHVPPKLIAVFLTSILI